MNPIVLSREEISKPLDSSGVRARIEEVKRKEVRFGAKNNSDIP